MTDLTDGTVTVLIGDVRERLAELEAGSVHCVVTSPPYWGLRDYAVEGQLGLEPTPEEYVENMVGVFREVRRVLRADGTCWLNLGDSYTATHHGKGGASKSEAFNDPGDAWRENVVNERRERGIPAGLKPKDLVGIPWRVAFALQADGWYLRSDIVWSKPNPMPESVTDRPTKAHEYLFLLTKGPRYFYDADAIREPHRWEHVGETRLGERSKNGGAPGSPVEGRGNSTGSFRAFADGGRNKRSVWEIATEPYPEAHFATFPQALVEPCVKAGCPEDGVVLDPFAGSGTTLLVARKLGRRALGVELSPEYAALIPRRFGSLWGQLSLLEGAV